MTPLKLHWEKVLLQARLVTQAAARVWGGVSSFSVGFVSKHNAASLLSRPSQVPHYCQDVSIWLHT
ncbi:hypothetical protein E2C01_095235 [Portunus trituberculatus]|uniref:Uncharacterized protein n=1 Tax=Portunus trituberculatus TaxID=210409 RepID=A0A5B7K369_PORTR|nr:hypothetical protein [Portunus trituberculatus]